jgi:hypothetical protein
LYAGSMVSLFVEFGAEVVLVGYVRSSYVSGRNALEIAGRGGI